MIAGFAQGLREFLFGPTISEPTNHDRQMWRDAIHEHRNVTQVSLSEAKKSKKKSSEAIAVAECAIKKLEQAHKDESDPEKN